MTPKEQAQHLQHHITVMHQLGPQPWTPQLHAQMVPGILVDMLREAGQLGTLISILQVPVLTEREVQAVRSLYLPLGHPVFTPHTPAGELRNVLLPLHQELRSLQITPPTRTMT
ncbi:hypothetical protein [Deinococcus sp. SL84]|uniref:hypothetical protein n=1 Tax=Deinococcus sp. SL84 TaxID=2994663 RepID=UPI002273A57A|nr:hypothetical protein [Deinococcus sp. SL84]MCY1703889.1 hypothetical protein [Deinococcus sp. SL84]